MRKTSIFVHFGPKWPILDNFRPKWGKWRFFSKKAFGTFFSRLQALTSCKVSEKSYEGIPIKMRKTSIFGHFGQFLDKMGETGFFFKKALGKFFPPFWVITNCKVSEKSNERILRYFRTNGRTDERTRAKIKVLTN